MGRNILLVPQQPQLFNTHGGELTAVLSVDNEALAEAVAWQGLESLGGSFGSVPIQERAERFSGGEMQRLLLTRMIYRRPKGDNLTRLAPLWKRSERKLFETL